MKYSSVTIKGLTIIQANILAIACEEGEIAELINEKINNLKIEEEIIKEGNASMSYDQSDLSVNHEADFE